jgi:hypothetical protein
MIFSFPGDPEWDDEFDAVWIGIEVGDYQGRVIIPRRLLQSLLGQRLTPEQAIGAVHQGREAFERAAEARILARTLDDDANIHLTGRDLARLQRESG